METKSTLVLTATLLFTLASGFSLASDGGIADQSAETDYFLLQGEELAEYYIQRGEPTAAGAMSESGMMEEKQMRDDGLTAVERFREIFGSNN